MNDKPRLIDANYFAKMWVPKKATPYTKSDDFIAGARFVLDEIEAMPTIIPTPQWIPVEEGLPKVYRDKYGELIPFLVCLKDTDYPFRAFFDGKTWGDGFFKLSVVAWMPLPEPYKMDGKEEK